MDNLDPNHFSWLALAGVVLAKALPFMAEELRSWRLLVQQLIRAKYGVSDEASK